MTTSGVTTTQLTRNTIVAAALRKLGVLALDQTPSTTEYSNGAEALNNLVAEYMTLGMPLWARKELSMSLVADQTSYSLGDGQTLVTALPLKITQAWLEPTATGSRQELRILAQRDFDMLPLESGTSGTPSQFTYQPKINYGTIRIWPAPDSTVVADKTMTIVYQSAFDSFEDQGNTPYFPREWNNALVYGLASLLAPEYGVPLQDRSMLKKEADAHVEIALDFGLEEAPMFFQPERRW